RPPRRRPRRLRLPARPERRAAGGRGRLGGADPGRPRRLENELVGHPLRPGPPAAGDVVTGLREVPGKGPGPGRSTGGGAGRRQGRGAMTRGVLTADQLEGFVELGFCTLPGAFTARQAAAACRYLWRRMESKAGILEADPSTWPDKYDIEEHLTDPVVLACF